MKITLFTGPRACGKTYSAISTARASGCRFVVICASQPEADSLRGQYADVETLAIPDPEHAKRGALPWDLVVIDGGEKFALNTIISLMGGMKDRGGDLVVAANIEGLAEDHWLRKFSRMDGVRHVELNVTNACITEDRRLNLDRIVEILNPKQEGGGDGE